MGIAEAAVEATSIVGIDEKALGGALPFSWPPAVKFLGGGDQDMRPRFFYYLMLSLPLPKLYFYFPAHILLHRLYYYLPSPAYS